MMCEGVPGWVRRAAHMVFLGVISGLGPLTCLRAADVTLAWDDSTSDPAVAGYRVYYGFQSRTVTNYDRVVEAGLTNSVRISNLTPGTTYWFAATTYNIVGLESEFSAELSYRVPNYPPTLNQPPDMTINQDSGLQTVALSGIGSGAANESQTLTVTAFSSNPQLVPHPEVNYTSPQSSGAISFTPAPGSFGTNTVTVMVDDGATVSNTVIRAFKVVVNQAPQTTNVPPTLDPIADIAIQVNSGSLTVPLSGISSGSSTENQTLTLTATSDTPSVVPNPVVTYTSPSVTGTLTLTPVSNASGTAEIAVTISDGQPTNGTITRLFSVTVQPPQELLTNTTISPNQLFKLVLNPPITNGHKFNFTLDASAPAGAKITVRKSIPSVVWIPTSAQASTTNLICIRATDTVEPTIETNLFAQVIVRDYMAIIAGSISAEAGQTGTIPIALTSSEGVTNLSFLLNWPTNRLSSPSISMVESNNALGSVEVQGTNLMVRIQTKPREVLSGSNVIALLSFRTAASQSSAFVAMPITSLTAVKPGASVYYNMVGQMGEIVVVGDVPLLRSTIGSTGTRALLLYGKVGSRYQIQYSTNSVSTGTASWQVVSSYAQTNTCQTVAVDSAPPFIFYRLRQE